MQERGISSDPMAFGYSMSKTEQHLTEVDELKTEQFWWQVWGFAIQELGFEHDWCRDLIAIQMEMSGGSCLKSAGWIRAGVVHWSHQCIDVSTAN